MDTAPSDDAGISRARGYLKAAAAICCIFGIGGWVLDFVLFRRAPLQDWMVFYSAARAFFDGNLPLIFDGEGLTAAINQRFASWLPLPLPPHPWVYPPPFLMLTLPFGVPPPWLSAALFVSTGWVACIAVVRRCAGPGTGRRLLVATLVLCPAVPFNVMTGQNAFFTTALLAGGFGMLPRFPLAGGALLGVLSVKPQFALMACVALAAARQWRALAAAAACAVLLALASLAVIGVEAWRAWLDLILGGNTLYSGWIASGRLNGVSVYACVSWLGAPSGVASLAQAAAAIAAAATVFRLYRQAAPAGLQLAVLLAATMLAAPHASNSDAVLLGVAAILFALSVDLRLPQLTVAAAVWISPFFNPPVLSRVGCFTPALVLLMLVMAVTSFRAQNAPEARPARASA
jgi:alpha-1,2-mannosyltransferase